MSKRWLIALGLIAGLCGSVRMNAQTIVIQGGTLIDGTGSAPRPNAVVVIEGNKIKAVGAKGEVAIPAGAKVINATGKTILPGLIDTQAQGDWSYAPPIYLYFGFTTIYFNGSEYMHKEQEAQKSGLLKGPRMFLSAGGVQGPVENLRPDEREKAKPFPEGWSVRTPEEAKAAVDKRIAAAPWGEMITVAEGITPELLRAVADEAHIHGLVLAGHSEFGAMTSVNGQDIADHMAGVIRSTVSNPEYISQMQQMKQERWPIYYPQPIGNYAYMMDPNSYDSLITKMIFNHQFLATTIAHSMWTWGTQIYHHKEWQDTIRDFAKNTPNLEFVPEDRRQMWLHSDDAKTRVSGRWVVGDQVDASTPKDLEGYAKIDEFLRRYVAAGGRLAGGGDNSNGVVPGLISQIELEQLVYSGLTPMQAILSVTKWAAEAYHHENEIGTIEVGKLADIITINGDPMKDIKATRNVDTMILDGKVIDRTLDPNWKNPIPEPPHQLGYVVPHWNN